VDILKMLSELRAERAQIEEVIIIFERLARGQGKRRGRPPKKWISEHHSGRTGSAENARKAAVSAENLGSSVPCQAANEYKKRD
jgi:hypothetical protein